MSPLENDFLLSERKLNEGGIGLLKPPNSNHCIITDSEAEESCCVTLNNGFYEIQLEKLPVTVKKQRS